MLTTCIFSSLAISLAPFLENSGCVKIAFIPSSLALLIILANTFGFGSFPAFSMATCFKP